MGELFLLKGVLVMEDIILFGASKLGQIAYNVLKKAYNICFFCDNDKNKWGKFFCEVNVISIDDITNYKDTKVIIASEYYGEISQQLKKLGMNDVNVFWYVDIDDVTYSKTYFVNKCIDQNMFSEININPKFKDKYIKDFRCIYKKDINNIYNFKCDVNGRDNEKNVLIVAYAFPPVGGSGVQRTLKFVKYLKEFGWNPIVITTENDYCPNEKDYTLLKEIPDDAKIINFNSELLYSEQLDRESLQEISNLIYGLVNNDEVMNNFINEIKRDDAVNRKKVFQPDMYIGWANEVLKNIEEQIDLKKIDMIYTTSSPYSDHLVGYYIKKKYNIPWIADYRDPWITYHYKSKLTKVEEDLEFFMEKSIIDTADRIIHVTSLATDDYIHIFKKDRIKIRTITNGYDENDFMDLRKYNVNKKFVITYGGTLHNNQFPKSFINAINELVMENKINKDLLQVNFYGKFLNGIKEKINEIDKLGIINCYEYVSHKEILEINLNSNMLFLPIGREDEFKSVYTGKIFEYMRLNVPILALSPKGSVVEEVIDKTKTGRNFQYDDINGIKDFILNSFELWKSGKIYSEYRVNEIEKYERKALTEKLVEVFNELI